MEEQIRAELVEKKKEKKKEEVMEEEEEKVEVELPLTTKASSQSIVEYSGRKAELEELLERKNNQLKAFCEAVKEFLTSVDLLDDFLTLDNPVVKQIMLTPRTMSITLEEELHRSEEVLCNGLDLVVNSPIPVENAQTPAKEIDTLSAGIKNVSICKSLDHELSEVGSVVSVYEDEGIIN